MRAESATTIRALDPSTGRALPSVAVTSPEQVRETIAEARAAQTKWAKTSFAERRRVLRCMAQAVRDHEDAICRLSALDTGKTQVEAYMGEVMVTLGKIQWVLDHGEETLKPEDRETGILTVHKTARVEYSPLGVLGVIAPWNYPFHNLWNHVISGLFAGNAVVLKVSEYSAVSGHEFVELARACLRACGHSADLVALVQGFAATGAALVSGGVDKVIFTGSPQVGKYVAKGASDSLTPCVLELGGKDPLVVTEDADLDQVQHIAARGALQNCGQNCIGVERFVVYESVHDEFVRRMEKIVRGIRQGAPLREDGSWAQGVDLGATTTGAQLAHIQALVDDAVAKGAKVVCGGSVNEAATEAAGGGFYFEPTILTGVKAGMRVHDEEVFGPVFSVIKVPGDSDKEAVRIVNGSPYGLGGSVFCRDVPRGERLAGALRAGMMNVNDFGLNYLAQSLPFGGVGVSGYGRFAGKEGLRECCLMKSVTSDKFALLGVRTSLPPPLQFPIGEGAVPFARGLADLSYGRTVLEQLSGIWKLATAPAN